jgi:hypothetical protein
VARADKAIPKPPSKAVTVHRTRAQTYEGTFGASIKLVPARRNIDENEEEEKGKQEEMEK